MFELLKTGMQDIIVGRHDGSVEVYTVVQNDEVTNEFTPPIEKFSYVCNLYLVTNLIMQICI